MKQALEALMTKASLLIEQADTIDALEHLRVAYLGKQGQLTQLLKTLSSVPASERPLIGQQVNQAKQTLSTHLDEKNHLLRSALMADKLKNDTCDVTLPGRSASLGSLHPVTQMTHRIVAFFSRLGFDVVQGPEVETEFYNFEALNIPPEHPARAMHDTFYFGDGRLLRTHTSNVQVRVMQTQTPPFRLIAPGRVYRRDSDATHTPMFHQVEGLFIDRHVTFSHLRHTLEAMLTELFEATTQVRFRPSYFPFTEPSAEIDMTCTECNGQGCRLCKMSGWIELGGCGMVHPSVLRAVNIDDTLYQGWAFGMGIDRCAMLYHGIDDLRVLFENDIEFLKQL